MKDIVGPESLLQYFSTITKQAEAQVNCLIFAIFGYSSLAYLPPFNTELRLDLRRTKKKYGPIWNRTVGTEEHSDTRTLEAIQAPNRCPFQIWILD